MSLSFLGERLKLYSLHFLLLVNSSTACVTNLPNILVAYMGTFSISPSPLASWDLWLGQQWAAESLTRATPPNPVSVRLGERILILSIISYLPKLNHAFNSCLEFRLTSTMPALSKTKDTKRGEKTSPPFQTVKHSIFSSWRPGSF